jgi:glycosyltransferase involved in cell wall biosynthesis
LIPSPGYNKNIGIGRLIDHAKLGFNLYKILKNSVADKPDVAFVGYPPIETAFVMVNWLKNQDIPCIIDVKDQWPTLFLDVVSKPFKPIAKLILFPYYYLGRKALQKSSAFCAMSEGYLDWIKKFSNKPKCNYIISPLTASNLMADEALISAANDWWLKLGVDHNKNNRIIFVGSFMSVFDFSIIKKVAKQMSENNVDCQFVICGDGGSANEIKSGLHELPNVVFPGWIDFPKMQALARCSKGFIAPYKNIDNFRLNIPNKIVDAIAMGLPIISPLKGEVEKLIIDNNIGYSADNQEATYEAICNLLNNEQLFYTIRSNCLDLYNSKFSSRINYKNLGIYLEKLAVRSF